MAHQTFEVSVTTLVIHNGRILLTKRASNKKRYANLWSFPGGHVEEQDYIGLSHNSAGVAYKIFERTARREVREETGIEITKPQYLTNMELGNGEVLVVSMVAGVQPDSAGLLRPDGVENVEVGWFTLDEALRLPLIDGVQEEILLAQNRGYFGL